MTICFTAKLCLRMMARTASTSSPGSMTMASREASSPMTEQLHCNGPTGRISWIIGKSGSGSLFRLGGRSGRRGSRLGLRRGRLHALEHGTGPVPALAKTDNVIEVTMKITADHVVALESAVAVPRGPNAVWLPCPPKAAAISPLLPLCKRTTMMRNRQTMT